MRKRPINLILVLIIGALTFLTCNDDSTEPASDPNVFCDDALCAQNEELKQKCIDAFNACMNNNIDANDDECVATALLICENI